MKPQDIIINELYLYNYCDSLSIEQIIKMDSTHFQTKLIKNISTNYLENTIFTTSNFHLQYYRLLTNLEKVKYL